MELNQIKKFDLLPIYNIKCSTLGNQGVGKTTMANAFASKNLNYDSTATIGVSYVCGDIKISDNQTIRLKIWDTAGSEKFNSITESYIRNSYIIFILFDLTDRNSWEKVDYWKKLSKYDIYDDNNLTNIVLIGCKSDLKNHKVSFEEIRKKAESWDCKWYTLSCKQKNSLSMINKIFHESAEKFHDDMIYNNENGYIVPSSILDNNTNNKYIDFYESHNKRLCCY